jgi:DNA-directed RNA polymerase subunit M/transcription elongation factor TFIIS
LLAFVLSVGNKLDKMIEQKNVIECDNCDYVIPSKNPKILEDGKEYINKPCPECGENLLTQKDYDEFNIVLDRLKHISENIPSEIENNTEVVASIKVHEGIKIDVQKGSE